MSAPQEKDEHAEMLNERARAMEQWFYQTFEDMDKKSIFAPPKQGYVIHAPAVTSKR